jgi:hypothetical protein
MGEDCNCVDCQGTAYCNPGKCGNDQECDHTLNACTCPSCANDKFCGDPTRANCKDGGVCDPFVEGCHCPDCWSYPGCMVSVQACAGGKPDGICDRDHEACDCVDCQGTPLCTTCQNTGSCTDQEPCNCGDCAFTKLCTDPAKCVNDGVCAIFFEGCLCDDCKNLIECAQWLPDAGGSDAGPG